MRGVIGQFLSVCDVVHGPDAYQRSQHEPASCSLQYAFFPLTHRFCVLRVVRCAVVAADDGWSDAGGNWYTPCCYVVNASLSEPTAAMVWSRSVSIQPHAMCVHKQDECMWEKPSQISACWGSTRYTASGFEIAYGALVACVHSTPFNMFSHFA